MKIILPYNVHRQIMFYVNNCDKEIGGMGRIKFDKTKGEYTVLSVCLPTQEVGSAHTDLDADSVAKCELATINDEGWFNFWWHSHVNMQAFWSSTDTATIKDMGKQGLCVAVVFNKRRECRGAVYARSEAEHVPDWFNDNISVEWQDEPCTMNDVWLAEIKNNVREKTYTPHTKTGKDWYTDDTFFTEYYNNKRGNDSGIRKFTGISNAYKKETRNLLRLCNKDFKDYLLYVYEGIKIYCSDMNKLSRSEVQDLIDSYPNMPQAKQIELMSKWYFIPPTWEIEDKRQTSILHGADI